MSEQNANLQEEDVTIVDNISASQEAALLDEKRDEPTKPKANILAPAKLKLLDSSSSATKNSRGEITVALNISASGTHTPTGPTASNAQRSRNKTQRNAAKQTKSDTPNAFEGSRGAEANAKRFRESGDTPPSATQKRKRNRNKKNKNFSSIANDVGQSNQQNATTGDGETASVPPVADKSQLIGSDAGPASGGQPNATPGSSSHAPVPPVESVSQSSDAGKGNATGSQQKPEAMDTAETADPGNAEGETYASVSNNLCVGVIDQRRPGSMTLMDENRFSTLLAVITDVIISQAGTKIIPPVFDDTRLHSGAMRVRCANFQTRQWLEQYVPTLAKKKLWKDASLVVTNFGDIPKPHKLNVFIRGIKKNAAEIFMLLARQNGITTSGWTALACEYKRDGTHLTIGVNADSFELIQQRSNTLFCGMGRAIFTPVKGCKENRTATQSSANMGNPSAGTSSGGTSSDKMETDEAQKPQAQS